MGEKTAISWTDATWNPTTGCTKISPGCKNCYAERMTYRLKAMGQINYRNGFEPTFHDKKTLYKPLHWKKPRSIFVCSMSDLFHEAISDTQILHVFSIMEGASWHRFQVLTKRSERLKLIDKYFNMPHFPSAHVPENPWPSNVWAGVTVESADYRYRIDDLRATGAAVKFLSIEPMIDDVGELDLSGIDWVIVGGESGPGARPMQAEWVRNVRDQCIEQNILFHFKQWGGVHKKEAGRILDGRLWDEMPVF